MIDVAKIGKAVGVRGDLKLHILSDFPQIFKQKREFIASRGGIIQEKLQLKVKRYEKGLICFEGYESLECAKRLTHMILKMSVEETQKLCPLQEGEFFWFDLLGFEIIENNECLGRIKAIDRIGSVDYLLIEANTQGKKLPKSFMIPYIERYILEVLCSEKKIYTQDVKEIWFAS